MKEIEITKLEVNFKGVFADMFTKTLQLPEIEKVLINTALKTSFAQLNLINRKWRKRK